VQQCGSAALYSHRVTHYKVLVDNAPTIVLILILLALLFVIAFSAGTEVAMLSVNRFRIRHRASLGERRARLLEKLLAQPDRWLGANLVILALASVAATTAATLLAQRTGQPLALPAMMIVLTVVMIVFCELAPKIFAAVHSEGVALGSA
jgi:Mg2+/Co2+ transporter CorB